VLALVAPLRPCSLSRARLDRVSRQSLSIPVGPAAMMDETNAIVGFVQERKAHVALGQSISRLLTGIASGGGVIGRAVR